MNPEARKYLAAIGRRGGKAKSDAKTEAVRANAKLGGWPKGRPRKTLPLSAISCFLLLKKKTPRTREGPMNETTNQTNNQIKT
jgi:hypothetical protein